MRIYFFEGGSHVPKNIIFLYRNDVSKLFILHIKKLQEAGLNFGLLFFIIYIGKHPGCSPSQLRESLSLDWGHSQRSISQLADKGFITKEKEGRHYVLNLTERGKNAFSIAHQVFFDWDESVLQTFTEEEKNQLFLLLEKAAKEITKEK